MAWSAGSARRSSTNCYRQPAVGPADQPHPARPARQVHQVPTPRAVSVRSSWRSLSSWVSLAGHPRPTTRQDSGGGPPPKFHEVVLALGRRAVVKNGGRLPADAVPILVA